MSRNRPGGAVTVRPSLILVTVAAVVVANVLIIVASMLGLDGSLMAHRAT